MEAPKLKQLLKVAEKRNPNWYPFIHGYLNGELDNMELDNDNVELGERDLFMGNYDTCVVAEPFGFNPIYKHGDMENCFICARFADTLCQYSGCYNERANDALRNLFANSLEQFYQHMEYMK